MEWHKNKETRSENDYLKLPISLEHISCQQDSSLVSLTRHQLFFANVIQGASRAHKYVIWHYVTICDAISEKNTPPRYLAHNHDRQVD